MENNKRLVYPDVLRIISIFGVIVIHAVGELLGLIPAKSDDWISLIVIDSLFRFSAPVFIMVSGMFMLSPEKDRGLKDLYSKKILRLVTSFAFWSAVYLAYNSVFAQKKDTTKIIINKFLAGEHHMWFMFMIIGLYIVTPILRKFVEDKKAMQIFIVVWVVFCLMKNSAALVPVLGKSVTKFADLFKIPIAVEYSGYYMLGFYLNKYPLKKPTKAIIYFFALVGTATMAVLTIAYPSDNAADYFDYLLPMTALQAVAVFILVKEIFTGYNPSPKAARIIASLSKISFGVYLSHLLVMKFVKRICLSEFSMPTLATFAIFVVLTTIFGTLISYILNKIPKANKYII